MRTRASTCRNGHDTSAYGARSYSGTCIACERERHARNPRSERERPPQFTPTSSGTAALLRHFANDHTRALIAATNGTEPCVDSPLDFHSSEPVVRAAAAIACDRCHIKQLCYETAKNLPGALRQGVWGGKNWGGQ